ncbi:type II toxin-antitoxin system PemK/MazF family toxin [Candidatus Peregrinibacteria bacterium]|nr:type II toxin-antitoxin system PemK/MazF family toxin [Candidatus Peregrinibacteria bacterium]MBT4631988.1 type II toxin-antitoxin system PemK/MazF family toxin [Candidatus Peregrinibacteria bacterium]MBT5823809.1 type II toxin-antitoxin system PemK/MazF family toxin [Candidatus Peregrinibacteria bacterium]
MYIKRFLEWIGLKEKLNLKFCKPPYVNEGDIWWASLGENIGSEINGKSDKFSRPVVIYKKLSHGFYFVIPTTSKIKSGSWYVFFKQKGRGMNACLHQGRSIDYRRLYSKLGRLDEIDYTNLKKGFLKIYR